MKRLRVFRGFGSVRLAVVCAAVALFAVLAFGSAPALAVSAWWHITSGARPTNIQPGSAQSEIQEITAPPGAVFELSVKAEGSVGRFEGAPFTKGEQAQATPANIQAALEPIYGAGNVVVTEGSAGPNSLVVRSVDGNAQQIVAPIEVRTVEGPASTVRVVTEGRPDGTVVVIAENLGDANVNGLATPIQVSDVLPPGVRALAISGALPFAQYQTGMSCSLESLTCTSTEPLPPYGQIELRIPVVVEGATFGENTVSVSGGETPGSSIKRPLLIGGVTSFGVADYELVNEEEGGTVTTQAGAHPFQQTTTVELNQGPEKGPLTGSGGRPNVEPAGPPKDLRFKWPPGLIGNPTVVPRCSTGQFLQIVEGLEDACPAQTAVGVAAVSVYESQTVGMYTIVVPLFSLEPGHDEPARFGFIVPEADAPVVIDTSLRTGGDYGITVSSNNITQTAAFLSAQVTVWGVPGDPRHDSARGWGCIFRGRGLELGSCNAEDQLKPPPLLSLPTSCGAPLPAIGEGDPWTQRGVFQPFSGPSLPQLDGCNRLPFSSQINVSPDGQSASTPTGLTVDVHVPQDSALDANGLANSNIKDIAVTLPEGVTLNPAAADGLQACSEGQIGYLPGESTPPGDLHFTSGLPAPQGAPPQPFCPDASKVATVKIKTPLLPNPLEGAVYLASPQNVGGAPQENPFESLIAMYLVAEDPVSGSLVKLPGRVSLNETTGQIVATFENTPQLAFEDAELHFFGGDRAPLSTPARCGTYTTSAVFTPWSGNPPINSQSSFEVTSGPHGSACPNPQPFAPSLVTGTTNINAGSFSPLTTTISREDGNQDIQSVQLHYPPGVSGILAGVKLCPEAQANAGTCSPESLVGHTTVSVGLGGDPFTVTGGQVFLTGPYNGAPFGLSIVNPAKAGPFDLGKVVVRAKIEVDPHTAALTVATDPSGAYAIPHILRGIPLQIKHVNVTIDRPGFTFNPTNCSPLTVTGTITSAAGASSALSVPFHATNCAILAFKPSFSVSTSGRTSRKNGASLTAKLSYPKAPFGTQAEISRVKVDLPKQLPSRLTTLQKACTNAQFILNPANCPAASKIGTATVTTPLLPVPLMGPAIFVSHGGEAFPSLTLVLQGYGVTIDLVGTTFISKKGITSTTFKTVPDVPFNVFELKLPQGKYSALAANGNLCKSKLAMPTAFVAQNGLVIHQTTKISVTGCKKAKKPAKKHRKKNKKR